MIHSQVLTQGDESCRTLPEQASERREPKQTAITRFAFVIHPLSIKFLHNHPAYRWTRYLPNTLVERSAAYAPPKFVSRITGAQSATTGQRVEGFLLALGSTPREMLRRRPEFTYAQLNQAARMAEQAGAEIMGLGAFTSVVGDAGITVAREATIAITSGNSLTVAATLEAAKQAAIKMGARDLAHGRVMIIGATGSIGSVCARLLALAVRDVVLVGLEHERLVSLKNKIEAETPEARVTIATDANQYSGECDLIVSATSAFGQRVLDISQCKPGVIICDVARPPDVNEQEAALRPDVLVIEGGEVVIPGDVSFGYDIGLPPKVSYACLAETMLLAMEGRFEDYTLGREISIERVKEIYHLAQKHGFTIAGLRSFERYLSDADIARKRELAQQLRENPELFARVKAEAAAKLATMPRMSKGVQDHRQRGQRMGVWGIIGLGLMGLIVARRWRQAAFQHKQAPAAYV